MNTRPCKFCHQDIPVDQFDEHLLIHLKKREDGQLTDYATLPPEERNQEKDRFEDAPKWYRHKKCGEVTGMPEEIIRTYLQEPWFYGAGRTYCTGCQRHVPESDCFWVSTNQPLNEYMKELRAGIPRPKPEGFIDTCLFYVGLTINKILILLEKVK